MTVATGEATEADPDQWLTKTTAVTGSPRTWRGYTTTTQPSASS